MIEKQPNHQNYLEYYNLLLLSCVLLFLYVLLKFLYLELSFSIFFHSQDTNSIYLCCLTFFNKSKNIDSPFNTTPVFIIFIIISFLSFISFIRYFFSNIKGTTGFVLIFDMFKQNFITSLGFLDINKTSTSLKSLFFKIEPNKIINSASSNFSISSA